MQPHGKLEATFASAQDRRGAVYKLLAKVHVDLPPCCATDVRLVLEARHVRTWHTLSCHTDREIKSKESCPLWLESNR